MPHNSDMTNTEAPTTTNPTNHEEHTMNIGPQHENPAWHRYAEGWINRRTGHLVEMVPTKHDGHEVTGRTITGRQVTLNDQQYGRVGYLNRGES